jgi:hypothetical protein
MVNLDVHYITESRSLQLYGGRPVHEEGIKKAISGMRNYYNVNGVDALNESTTHSVLDNILVSAARELENGCGIVVQRKTKHYIISKNKQGFADMAIVSGEAILLAIEVKVTNLEKCAAQNVVQVQAVYQQNRQKGINLGNIMYGIAITLTKSVLLRTVFDDEDKGIITKAILLSFGDDKTSVGLLTEQADRFLDELSSTSQSPSV